ncbi:MAG: fumarate hydratase, partial [Armatimonadetes bacterium]|nr:fumarate hydratase [Armatimonadota bacterium]
EIARKEKLPLCQDTGISVVFVEMGQDVHIVGGYLNEAIHEGVRQGYQNGNLRKSVVGDPLFDRVNTRDNTPAVIHVSVTEGNALKITVCPRGAGGENMSALAMLNPSDGVQGVVDFVVSAVEKAGANACPPMVVGVGVGGTSEMALLLAKKASLRSVPSRNTDARVADLETSLLHRINALGIGPEGFGGIVTALDVHIETYPCHISGLPVGVNLMCHAARHKEAVL